MKTAPKRASPAKAKRNFIETAIITRRNKPMKKKQYSTALRKNQPIANKASIQLYCL